MPMTFEEAESRFRQLQARVQRGESISRAEYEEEVGKLAVQDRNGTLWEINPRTGKWMYFDGAEWVSGAPPGHETSTVIPVPKEVLAAREPSSPPRADPDPLPPSSIPLPSTPLPRPARSVAPTRSPISPSDPPPFSRTESGAKSPARPKSLAPPPGGAPGDRPARAGAFGDRSREWVPLAIASVVLLLCAILLFGGWTIGSRFFGGPTPTQTRAVALLSPTLTKVPTTVFLPSPTPIPPTPAPVVAKAPDGANVRDKPTTKGAVVIKLAKNAQITLIGIGPTEGANTWYQVNVPDKPNPAWIRSDTIQVVSGDAKTLPVVGAATPTPPKGAAAPPAAPPAAPVAAATPTVLGVPNPKPYP